MDTASVIGETIRAVHALKNWLAPGIVITGRQDAAVDRGDQGHDRGGQHDPCVAARVVFHRRGAGLSGCYHALIPLYGVRASLLPHVGHAHYLL